MAKKLKFSDFKEAIEKRAIPFDKLNEYVELDPFVATPRLRIIPDALLDNASSDYDIDKEIYNIWRENEEREYDENKMFGFFGRERIVAEGDSWFNLPPLSFIPKTIAERMKSNGTYKIKNIAYWGHTIKRIYSEKEYLEKIDQDKTDYFMLSAGGNDLQNGLENKNNSSIKEYDPDIALNDYLTQKGHDILGGIEEDYRGILNEVTSSFPEVKIYCHGYDYPRPLVGKGKYIGRYFRKKDIPDDLMTPIMAEIMDLFNKMLSQVIEDYGSTVTYINCRNITKPYTWKDDMHPGSDGFKALANEFERTIG
jgi:hypothetical protein